MSETPGADDHRFDSSAWFDDPSARMDFDLHVAWARRIPACEKTRRPLPDRWSYSPEFLDTVTAAETTVGRERILDACVDALTGLDERLPSRARHMLRTDRGGDSAPRVGVWGRPIWRTSVTAGPGGWRLHVTRDADGRPVLLDVSHHDRGLR